MDLTGGWNACLPVFITPCLPCELHRFSESNTVHILYKTQALKV